MDSTEQVTVAICWSWNATFYFI